MGRTILQRMVLTLLIYSVGCIVLYYILDNILDGITLNVIRDLLDYPLYYIVNRDRDATTAVVYFVGVVAIILYYFIRTLSNFSALSAAMRTLLDQQGEIPSLHPDFQEFEISMRDIKMQVTEERIAAREAEQRKNDLVVYLAHDLKTPLASVIGYLTLLNESPQLPEEQRAGFTRIVLNKALRLEELINEFFEITRFNLQYIELERSSVDLSMMLRQITDEFYPVLSEHDLALQLSVPPGVRVIGDADKLARVFDNLLRNAANYSYSHTTVEVTLQDTEEGCCIRFSNQGDEIPPARLERIFEKFFRLDSARGTGRGGSGLGLAIARQIVELHGGHITAESSMERTTFTVTLPHHTEERNRLERKT